MAHGGSLAHGGPIAPQACTTIRERRFHVEGVESEAMITPANSDTLDASDATILTLEKEDIDYLISIRDILEDMKPFTEIEALAKGCPDPDRYSD